MKRINIRQLLTVTSRRFADNFKNQINDGKIDNLTRKKPEDSMEKDKINAYDKGYTDLHQNNQSSSRSDQSFGKSAEKLREKDLSFGQNNEDSGLNYSKDFTQNLGKETGQTDQFKTQPELNSDRNQYNKQDSLDNSKKSENFGQSYQEKNTNLGNRDGTKEALNRAGNQDHNRGFIKTDKSECGTSKQDKNSGSSTDFNNKI